ncbi:hypothetical protein CASFOL_016143 [Castilleja foliolosa]|uniref:KIB1-4 beta-propeller domain-containing protein n=1 Tax=Castilleja foliolosa TaxID=1961234 RepID=A0ABD3DFR1_9LAMI
MSSCKPSATPVDSNAKLGAAAGSPLPESTQFRSLCGALQYLTFTRPDIAYAVQQVCLHMHAPHTDHWNALKRILRYIQGTKHLGIHLTRSAPTSLRAYTDADWAGCPTTRRSTSGYCVYLGDNLISWSSKRQTTISRSSAEAEYRGVANVVSEISWLRNLLLELEHATTHATLVYCDNVSSIYLAHNPVQHQRTKHIELDIHFVREKVRRGLVRVIHVPSRYQVADIFTKGLPRILFLDFRSSLSIMVVYKFYHLVLYLLTLINENGHGKILVSTKRKCLLVAITSFQGKIYGVISRRHRFVTIEFIGTIMKLRTMLINGERSWKVPVIKRNWVVRHKADLIYSPSNDELLLVIKDYTHRNYKLTDGSEYRVFRVDINLMECIEVDDIGDHTILISKYGDGICCSSSVTDTFKPNSIYHTRGHGAHIYVYDLNDKSTTSLLPPDVVEIKHSRNYWLDLDELRR